MKDKVRRLITIIKLKKGQGLVEYALLAGFIALTALFALKVLGETTLDIFTGFIGKFAEINSTK